MSNKFQQAIEKTKRIYGEVFRRYPVTMVAVLIATLMCCLYTILYSFDVINSNFGDAPFSWWMMVSIYTAVGCFAVEALPDKFFETNKVPKKVLGTVIAFIISSVLITFTTGRPFGMAVVERIDNVYGYSVLAWTMAYFVLSVFCVFYNRYKESKATAEKYFVSVFVGFIQICIAWGVMALGFSLLTIIFDTLITDPLECGYLVPQFLVIGLYVAPNTIMNFTDVKEEVGKFFEALIKYALMILTIMGAAIIYLYMVKTLITGMPSNEIFSICSALFFVAIPVGFSCTAFAKDTALQKVAYALPYIYAPFILLQGYAIFSRINEYGITQSRYMGVVLVILEVLYTVLYALGRKHIDKLILVMMAITVVVTLIPGINVNDASKLSQKSTIKRYIEEGMPKSPYAKDKLLGAYNYLFHEFGEDYVDGILSPEQKLEITTIKGTQMTSEPIEYDMVTDEKFYKTEGYDNVANFTCSSYGSDASGDDIDTQNMMINISGVEFGPFDLTDELNSVEERCKTEDLRRINGPDEMIVSDDCKIVFTAIYINKDIHTGYHYSVRYSGYMLFNDSYYEIP